MTSPTHRDGLWTGARALTAAGAFLGAVFTAAAFAAHVSCTPLGAAPDAACPTVVTTHVVDDQHCAALELVLDSGVSKHVCLRADQLDRAITEMP